MALFEIKNLNFIYPDAEKPALHDINFEIQPGEFIVICGKSGCGKTTLLRHFKTVMSPYGKREGQILFNGELLEEVSVRRQSSDIDMYCKAQITSWLLIKFGMNLLLE